MEVKAAAWRKKEKNLAPTSAIAWRAYGGGKYYTPSAFGGNVKEAIAALEKSIQCFEKKPEQLKSNWLYIDTIALLGQAYLKNEEKAKAIVTYEKAIGVEPSFAYAKALLAKAKK